MNNTQHAENKWLPIILDPSDLMNTWALEIPGLLFFSFIKARSSSPQHPSMPSNRSNQVRHLPNFMVVFQNHRVIPLFEATLPPPASRTPPPTAPGAPTGAAPGRSGAVQRRQIEVEQVKVKGPGPRTGEGQRLWAWTSETAT